MDKCLKYYLRFKILFFFQAEVFETTSTKLRRKYFWQHQYVKIGIASIVIFVSILVIVLITLSATGQI